MDNIRRKVGHYTLKVVQHGGLDSVCPTRLVQTLCYITALDPQQRFRDLADDRFMFLESSRNPDAGDLFYLVFTSAKTKYRPALRHRETGARRDNPKQLVEGEECKTHVVLKFTRDQEGVLLPGCHVLIEEFKYGVGIADVAKYINSHLKTFQKTQDLRPRHQINIAVILPDDFLAQVRSALRITKVTVNAQRQILGSEHLNYSNRVNKVDRDVEVVIRPVRGESLADVVEDFVERVTHSDSGFDASSIRIDYEDFEDNKAAAKASIEGRDLKLVESLGKVDFIEVSRNESTGETVSTDCFRQMKVLF